MKKTILTILILSSLTVPVCSQDKNGDKKEAEKIAREFLEVSGAIKSNRQGVEQMIRSFSINMSQIPPAYWNELSKELNPDEITELVIPVYVELLTINDMKQLIEFYKSPVGKKYAERLPLITEKSMKIGQKWGQELGQKIQKKLQQKGY